MNNELTSAEFHFLVKLQVILENGIEIKSFTTLGYLTGVSMITAKRLVDRLHKREAIKLNSSIGRNGGISIELLVDPMNMIKINT